MALLAPIPSASERIATAEKWPAVRVLVLEDDLDRYLL
jgi:hypothetical protein